MGDRPRDRVATGEKRIVTADATKVPDFYERLGVDPSADRAEIEAALQRKQPAWSMGTRNPKNRHVNQLYLDEIPVLRKALLSDPASRAAYDAELAVGQMRERERKLDELQRRVRLRAAKGGLLASDRGLLGDEAARLGLGEEDLLKVIRPIPNLGETASKNGDAAPDVDPPADVLDPSTRRQIRVALEHLGCRDLYDAIGVERDAPPRYITERADAERQRWMKKAQVTAEKTAWLEIITHAQSHLGSTKARARYDRTLALEAEESFDALATFALKGLSRLDPGTQAALVEEAAALGIPSARAEILVARICRRLGVTLEAFAVANATSAGQSTSYPVAKPPVNGSAKFTLLRCRHCAGVTEMSPVSRKSTTARCRHCGGSLKWDCPVCKRNQWVDERRCACGFRQSLAEPVIKHFDAAQRAFRTFQLERALEHLERVRQLAPDHAGARSGIVRVRQRQAGLLKVQLAYQTAKAGGRLFAARAAVEAWSRVVDPDSPELQAAWSELGRDLRRAETLAARARNLERTDPPAARALYRQSLAVAADLPDALAGLGRTPPDPPTVMDAQVLGDRIRLWWTPPPPDGLGPLTYVILRKRGAALQHPGDGTRVAEVSTSEFDDTHVPPGDTVGYAVLSKRGGVESISAISLGPFVFLADVKDVRVEFRQHVVELAWQPPRGVSEIRVIRKRGAPPKDPRDGDRIASALDHAVDRTIDPNESYHYGIFAIYKMADGRLFPAPGVVVSARPQPSVSALDAPRLLIEPGLGVRIDWNEPLRGAVKLLRTPGPLPVPAGTRLPANEAEALDGHRIEPASPGRAYDPEPPAEGYCYYTPLTVWNGTYMVGHGVALSRVPDPSELRATRAGGTGGVRVTLRWQWAAQASATLVVARRGAPPTGTNDPAAIIETVSFADYDRLGSWTLNLPATPPGDAAAGAGPAVLPSPPDVGPWHIRVYSLAELDGVRSISPGFEPTAATVVPGPNPEVTVSYVLKRPWFPGFPWSVTFQASPPGTPVPAMVLVSHPRAVPLSVDDGEIVARFPAGPAAIRHPVPKSAKIANYGVRAFPDPEVEPASITPIQLQHPESGATRV
jgi:tetratricopeptide (TPR) repeat protein